MKKFKIMELQDILLFNDQLSEEELIIHRSAREYCQQELLPRIVDANRNETFDIGIYKEMGSLGFLGAPIKGYGCAGTNYVSYGLIAREIERVDSSYRSAFSVQTSLAMHAIYEFGSEEQKDFYLPVMAKGDKLGCFGLTEADAGSDPASMKTKAVEKDGGYVLNGSKNWITNSPIADVLIIWAKDEQEILRGFIVDRDSKGLSTPKIDGKFALRASTTGQIFLEDVFVPKDKMLPNVQSFRGPFSCLNMARYGIAWGAMGAAEFCWEASLNYSLERVQFGKPISSFQAISFKLADMVTEIEAAELLIQKASNKINNGEPVTLESAMCKLYSSELCVRVSNDAVQIFGGYGYIKDFPVEKFYRDSKLCTIGEGTSEIQKLVISRKILTK